jgi:hypothetical protein
VRCFNSVLLTSGRHIHQNARACCPQQNARASCLPSVLPPCAVHTISSILQSLRQLTRAHANYLRRSRQATRSSQRMLSLCYNWTADDMHLVHVIWMDFLQPEVCGGVWRCVHYVSAFRVQHMDCNLTSRLLRCDACVDARQARLISSDCRCCRRSSCRRRASGKMCLRTCLHCSSFLMQAMISGLLTFPWNLSRGYGYIYIHIHKYI